MHAKDIPIDFEKWTVAVMITMETIGKVLRTSRSKGYGLKPLQAM